jgi:hypothetical protein
VKQKITILFFNSYGNQVGCDDIPYPPGTAYVQFGVGEVPDAPHGILRADPSRVLTPGEVRQFEDALTQAVAMPSPAMDDPLNPAKGGRLGGPLAQNPSYHLLHGVPVEPAGLGIIFGADSREVLPGEERPLHPLTSQCRCGRQITKLTSDGGWAHSD